MKSVNEILRGVRELLSDRKRWTKGKLRRGVNDLNPVTHQMGYDSYCLIGAIQKVGMDAGSRYRLAAVTALANCIKTITGKPYDVVQFNDRAKTSHKKVLEVLDCAIKGTE